MDDGTGEPAPAQAGQDGGKPSPNQEGTVENRDITRRKAETFVRRLLRDSDKDEAVDFLIARIPTETLELLVRRAESHA